MQGTFLTKKWVRKAFVVASLVAVMSIVDYVWGVNSDALLSAREALQGSIELQKRVGQVQSIDLDWLWGFRRKSGSAGANATVHVTVTGTSGREHMVVDLQEIGGRWVVVSTSARI